VNKNPTDATVCRYLFTAKLLHMFRVSQHPSSGVLKIVTAASGTGHNTGAATSLQRGLIGTESRSDHVGREFLILLMMGAGCQPQNQFEGHSKLKHNGNYTYHNVNKNPTSCNSIQIFIYCKVTLHVSGVTAPIIRSTKTCTGGCGYSF